uniref:Uncharacterized protein n=1 Tax=Trichuris muris TaxID=70415 RepID=A0A5S6QX24_TRIMR
MKFSAETFCRYNRLQRQRKQTILRLRHLLFGEGICAPELSAGVQFAPLQLASSATNADYVGGSNRGVST